MRHYAIWYLRSGDFFLARLKKPRSDRNPGVEEVESDGLVLPDLESDLEDGRCFHMSLRGDATVESEGQRKPNPKEKEEERTRER